MTSSTAVGTPATADGGFWPPVTAEWSPRGGYRAALVCRSGHTEDHARTSRPTGNLGCCAECGEDVLGWCGACGRRIRGSALASADPYVPPGFCDCCGEPHPWASRDARIQRLQQLLRKEHIDPELLQRLGEDLEGLRREPGLGDHDQAEIFKRIKKYAPGTMQAGAPIIRDLLTTAVKQKLGLC